MSIGIPIRVNFQSVKDAAKETANLRKQLVDLGSMDVPVHTRMDTSHAGTQSSAAQYTRTIQQSIERIIKGSSGNTSIGSNGHRVYTSPNGTQYGYRAPVGIPGGAGSSAGNSDFSFTGLAKSAFPYLLAGMGISSVKSFMMDAKEQAKSFELSRIDLSMRGYTATDARLKDAAKLGYSPLEQHDIAETLNRTGLTGKHLDQLTGTAMYQGRGTAVGGQAIASYMEKMFPAIGKTNAQGTSERLNTSITNLYKAATALGQGSRYSEVLASNQQLLTHLVSARGGEGLDGQGISKLALLQMGLWKTGKAGEGAAGVNLISGMDQGIRRGGSDPGSQMFLAQAMGIDKVHSLSQLWDFKLRKSRGASDLSNVIGVFNQARLVTDAHGLNGADSNAMQKLAIEQALGTLQPYQVEALMQPGFQQFIRQADSNPKAAWSTFQDSSEYKRLMSGDKSTKEWMENLGAQALVTNAGNLVSKLPMGRKALLLENTGKDITSGALNIGGRLLNPDPMGPPSMSIPAEKMTLPQLEENVNYLSIRRNNPRLLGSLQKLQKDKGRDTFTSGVDMTYTRPSPSISEPSQSSAPGNTDSLISTQTLEVTKRLDRLIEVLSGRYQDKPQERPTGLDARFKRFKSP